MSTAPGIVKLVKGGFVQLDATNAKPKIIVFQYNPETLIRRIQGVSTSGLPPVPPAVPQPILPGVQVQQSPPGVPPSPREFANFTLELDAADKLQTGDPLTQQSGLLPAISALELLLYPVRGSLTIWVSGGRRVLPVQIMELQILEQAFDPALNPIRAEVAVTLMVLKDADLANDPRGRAIWDAHFAVLQQLAKTVYDAGTLAALGLTGI